MFYLWKNFWQKRVENAFIKLLEKITPKEKFVDLYKEAILDRLSKKVDKHKKEIHEKNLLTLKQKRERIFTMYENGIIPPKIFRKENQRLR